jgi:hypothetical protein
VGQAESTGLARYVLIGDGTHTVMMEKNRLELFHNVQMLLDEGSLKWE